MKTYEVTLSTQITVRVNITLVLYKIILVLFNDIGLSIILIKRKFQ